MVNSLLGCLELSETVAETLSLLDHERRNVLHGNQLLLPISSECGTS